MSLSVVRGRHMLQTCVKRVEYDFEKRVGKLFQDTLSYCDMTECIEFFKRIDDRIIRIETFVADEDDNDVVDVIYKKAADWWEASRP